MGATERVPARLIAQPVSPEEAARRRRQVAYRARRTWHRPSEDALALCSWHVCITTLPADLVSAEEAFILLRARWHIELLFKRWKCWGKVDAWRSQQPWRILCEVDATLLGALVQHWCAVVTCWQDLDRSLVKAGEVMREHARALLRTLTRGTGIQRVLREIGEDCQIACRVNRRNAKPSHSQLIREQHHAAYA